MKYISPGSWFSLEYPNDWREFEDEEDSFLFYNPEKWNGNFRISAYRGKSAKYAQDCMADELQQNQSARRGQVGPWPCVYSAETFQENGAWYTSHIWVTGKGTISVECSFTVPKGESPRVAEEIIRSLKVREENEPLWKEIIPVRALEISVINECYDWAVSTIKKQLTKDFTATKQDVESIQRLLDSGRFNKGQRTAWESFGIAFGTILVNEMDGMDWVTVIDGKKEYPALRFGDSSVMVSPLSLVWDYVRSGKSCDLKAEYARIESEVEKVLNE